ncbi:MAG: ABC-F family ATP-binding cassette domain-containing protein [Cyanobacteria bacterium SZAS-4]|nr:ABC-F family ATP-binding cassette domain-containing protein [Cyanobacteria bacterium SZAS-4]
MLRLERICKIFPHGEVLKDVTWELKPGDRAGLVGPNGGGKSTQLKIIMGEIEPTSGRVIKSDKLRIGYLTQEFEIPQTSLVRDAFASAFVELNDILAKLADVHHKMETAQGDELDKLLKRMDDLQRSFEAKNGYAMDSQVEKMIADMEFNPGDGDRQVGEFSGGWQMRMNLGRVLLTKPDILLLDEPTNHIDLETIEWLEKYLREQTTPMVIVSHDRYFLDRLCTSIIEMERGEASVYLGNYTSYLEQRAFNREAQLATFERQQKELERQQQFVDRFRASATRSTQAKSREKQLDKIELVDEPDSDEKTLHFRFPAGTRSGRNVASVKNLMHVYDDNIIFMDANLHVERGDKIAILGPNGCGKSTFLRLVAGRETPSDGFVTLGDHNIHMAYFEQNQAEALDLKKTALETIAEQVPDWKTTEIRGLLGKFLFSGDAVYKRVESLSGGEKARLAMAQMLLGSNNFLLLDEPTNHLDIPAKETLEEALREFDGTAIIVSHDRYFISQVATKIVEVRDHHFVVYHGNYEYYLDRIAAEKEKADAAKAAAEKAAKDAAKRAKEKEKNERKGKK